MTHLELLTLFGGFTAVR